MIKFEMLNSKAKKIDPTELNIAGFERKINRRHLNELKQAILKGDLKDNIITVLKKNDKYEIIDGQHRVLSCEELQEEDPSFSYKLTLRVVDGDGLNAYLCINKGKPLTANDYTKAIDDGYCNRIPFFNELKDYCSHYGSTTKLRYSTIISCYAYAIRDGFKRDTRKDKYVDIVMNVKKHDLIRLKSFLYDCKLVFGKDVREWFYKKTIIANLLKIHFNYFNSIDNFQRFLKRISKDQWLKHNSVIYNTEAFTETYMFMERTYIKK